MAQFLNNTDDFGDGPVRDYVGYGENTPQFSWPGGAAVAINIVVNYEEGSEYSLPMGDGKNDMLAEIQYSLPGDTRDLTVESVYEYGSRVGVWRLMRIFNAGGVASTFFATAVALTSQLHSDALALATQAARRGAAPLSHSGGKQHRQRIVRMTADAIVEILERATRPESLLKQIRLRGQSAKSSNFLDNDRPAPHRGQDEDNDNDLDDDVGAQHQADDRKIGIGHRSSEQRGLDRLVYNVIFHELAARLREGRGTLLGGNVLVRQIG